ncbi:MAG TPA: hypothetical protein VMR20_04105 [Verrucomicrobiae bacterium]|nr:hypothetical protein [Verrucomicrobiae bacterium]
MKSEICDAGNGYAVSGQCVAALQPSMNILFKSAGVTAQYSAE